MTADTVGGVWTYALELADALESRGAEVWLATMGRRLTPSQSRQVSKSAVAEVRESDFDLEWMPEPWASVERAGEWLISLEDESRPDVVHLNGYVHADLRWRAPTLVVGHSDVLSWWSAVERRAAPSEWETYRARVASGLTAAGGVVTPTAAVLHELRRHYGIDEGVVVPNGRDGSWVAPVAKEPLVLSAGRLWDHAKNASAVARVASVLPWPVVIAGDVAHPGGGPSFSAENVVLLGGVSFDELAQWMLRASVFALPARYEPFGLAALEAGLAGCALVLGDIPSLREVWADAALFVDPFDDDDLANAIGRLVHGPALVSELGRRARARATTFSPARTADGYIGVYDRLLGRVSAAGGGR